MADEADRARAREEEHRADALAAWRRNRGQGAGAEGRSTCLDCGEAIPRARREAVPGVRRCVECEADTERGR